MRYAMSILSRFRTKWGKKHFEILVKTLEYGYATRKMGLKYNGNQADDKTNVLEGYADSSLSLPRSQGCRCVVMNNAAVSFTSKRHTTTDDSTAAAELTEQYLCACDEGYRNVMQEMGLMQDGAAYRYLAGQPSRDPNCNESWSPCKENKSNGHEGDDHKEQD